MWGEFHTTPSCDGMTALRAHGAGVREFVIMDADTVAPAGFFAELSGRLAEEEKMW